jgi:hypothetical protein
MHRTAYYTPAVHFDKVPTVRIFRVREALQGHPLLHNGPLKHAFMAMNIDAQQQNNCHETSVHNKAM